MDKDTVIKFSISLVAFVLLAARLLFPELKVDAISIGLLVICLLPWAPSFIKSLKAPGGWELELKELDSKVQKVIDASSEDDSDNAEINIDQPLLLSEEELTVLNSLTKADVPLRSVSGIAESSKIDARSAISYLELLEKKGLVTQVHGKIGIRWGITPIGRKQLEASKI